MKLLKTDVEASLGVMLLSRKRLGISVVIIIVFDDRMSNRGSQDKQRISRPDAVKTRLVFLAQVRLI